MNVYQPAVYGWLFLCISIEEYFLKENVPGKKRKTALRRASPPSRPHKFHISGVERRSLTHGMIIPGIYPGHGHGLSRHRPEL